MKVINEIGNILWLATCGIISATVWLIAGVLFGITIIGIPVGKQCFSYAKLMILPQGKTPDTDFSGYPLSNLFWFPFGVVFGLYTLACALILAVSIVGLPYAMTALRFTPLAIMPFGAEIKDVRVKKKYRDN